MIQAYALANLLFWFVLLGALSFLFRPWTWRHLLCLGTGLLSYGVIASMERALVDLPAAALIFAGAAIGTRAGAATLARRRADPRNQPCWPRSDCWTCAVRGVWPPGCATSACWRWRLCLSPLG